MERSIKVVVAGGRDFSDYTTLKHVMNHLTKNVTHVTVICGKARGADSLGERWAREMGHTIEEYLPDWDKYGKSAGYKRNMQMAKAATAVVAFWDGVSKGTGHMIDIAKLRKLPVRVVPYGTQTKATP